MKIINFPNKKGYSNLPKVFALGKFQALHLGHKKILEKAKKIAEDKNYELVIMIYINNNPKDIWTIEEKIEKLQKYNPQYIMAFEPNKDNFKYSKSDFEKWLLDINAKSIVVGEDFTYGTDRIGQAKDLISIFDTHIESFVKYNGDKISTKQMLDALNNADTLKFKELVGDYFSYEGIVVRGLGNGKKFNLPTANIEYPKNKWELKEGLYYSFADLGSRKNMPSLTSISYNPTLNAKYKTYETYIYDFDEEIYGETLKVQLIEKYGDSIKFSSVEQLIDKLAYDKKMGKIYFFKRKKVK